MTPLDDQLRAAMRARADVLAPSPDPLAGIESRARGMKRRRAAAAVAGAALAVAAIAVAVPSISDSFSGTKPLQFASATPEPTTGSSSAELDPAQPWTFRGIPLTTETLTAFRRDWSEKHPGSTLTPLYGDVLESTQQEEAAFVASGPDGDRYGFAIRSEGGSNFWYDEALPAAPTAVTYVLPGDEAQRLLVIASPSSRRVQFASDGTTFTDITPHATGVAQQPRQGIGVASFGGDQIAPRVRVTGADGTVVYDQPVSISGDTAPANVLDWPTRGADESDLLPAARKATAPSLGATADTVELKVLFAGSTDSGVSYVMGQAWKRGADAAYSFSYAEGGTNGPQPFVGTATAKSEQVLAFLVSSLPGTTTDLLVVIPAPRTTQVLYSAESNTNYRAPADTPGTDGVVLIDRVIDRGPGLSDHLQLLTGNGDPATDVIAEGPVAKYLCGTKECG